MVKTVRLVFVKNFLLFFDEKSRNKNKTFVLI